jgi:hypothetical protein
MTAQHPSVTLGADLPTLVGHILATWERASDHVRDSGAAWYADAHHVACELDPEAPARAAGVIAALSPQTSWDLNVRLAKRAYADDNASGHTRLFCRRANAILVDGETPDSVLGGRKVRAFFALIAEPFADWFTVCVDRHAVAVALGRTLTNRERKVLERVGVYDYVADAYRCAASALGLAPHVVQAATWLQWRNETAPGWAARDRAQDQLTFTL